jgi:hypothetical protein
MIVAGIAVADCVNGALVGSVAPLLQPRVQIYLPSSCNSGIRVQSRYRGRLRNDRIASDEYLPYADCRPMSR